MSSSQERREDLRRADFIVGAVALFLGCATFLLIPSEVNRNAFQSFGDVRSPAFFPVIASGLLIVFSAFLILRSRPKRKTEPGRRAHPDVRVATVAGILVAAGASMTQLGFLPTAFALIIGLSFAFGARSFLSVLLLAIVVPAAIHFLFRSVLNVLLPAGDLF